MSQPSLLSLHRLHLMIKSLCFLLQVTMLSKLSKPESMRIISNFASVTRCAFSIAFAKKGSAVLTVLFSLAR